MELNAWTIATRPILSLMKNPVSPVNSRTGRVWIILLASTKWSCPPFCPTPSTVRSARSQIPKDPHKPRIYQNSPTFSGPKVRASQNFPDDRREIRKNTRLFLYYRRSACTGTQSLTTDRTRHARTEIFSARIFLDWNFPGRKIFGAKFEKPEKFWIESWKIQKKLARKLEKKVLVS